MAQLHQQHADDSATRLVQEMGLFGGDSRIDVAVVNGRLAGFEIKSDSDTLQRLERQLAAYRCVFDELTFVAGRAHTPYLEEYLPDWCGLIEAQSIAGAVVLETLRQPQANPEVDLDAVLRLLWKPELQQMVAEFAVKISKSASKEKLREALCKAVSKSELLDWVRRAIKVRTNWRAESPPTAHDDLCPPLPISLECPAQTDELRSPKCTDRPN